MNNITDVILNLYKQHKDGYAELYAIDNDVTIDNVPEKAILASLEADFRDKNFSEKEINEIFNNMISTHTLYKLGAYMIALYNQPESFEAWKISIVEDVGVELPEDECLELWKAYQEVDY